MKNILYISTNDGSDMRITKEVKTLSAVSKVIFIGIGKPTQNSYAQRYCAEYHLVDAKRNSPKSFLLQYLCVFSCLWRLKINSIHIINEQLMVFYYPLVLFKHTVLDIFDSILLKKGLTGKKWNWLKYLVYLPIDVIIVTDDNRKNLMPAFTQSRIEVLENYPYSVNTALVEKPDYLQIFYGGSLSSSRGTLILEKLIKRFDNIKITAAGWLADEATKKFVTHNNVNFLGTISQDDAQLAALQCHYIMCCYEPSNMNNINASPNKIYDAIQLEIPVIINSEVKVSGFVEKIQLGYILPSFYEIDYQTFGNDLINNKDSYTFENIEKKKFSWEAINYKLLKAHGLNFKSRE
ncbi:glycosyltransferase family protein [Nonlabens ponticola]|uniref:Glycosyltransferase n=1 Tax=Nonlabens ponticola TaxID=2496866 RepID=A0A3S9N038_9FLAO|nr:hypothetical protein [Nonlabens ponticola]AZQ44692.1 hypothetical protein EJ995_10740 [Nonlabens ponticola]